MNEGELKAEDEVDFVVYESLSTQEEISTKKAELAIKAAETAETQTEAAKEAVSDDYSYDYNYSSNSGSSGNDYSYSEPAADPAPVQELIASDNTMMNQGTED